jgi:hypothetical protein
MAKLTKIMKNSGISANTKLKFVQTIVFPAVLYEYESSTLRKTDERTRAFEHWTCGRLLGIPWTAKNSNAVVIKQIKPRNSPETLAVRGKLKYFGHLMRMSHSLEKDFLGFTDRNRRQGRQPTNWKNNAT